MKKLFTLIAILFTGYIASASCAAHFNTSKSGLTVNFLNSSTPPSHSSPLHAYANWDFGDGGYSSVYNPSHTYSAAGKYYVTLYVEWVDSATSSYVCDDTLVDSVTVTAPGSASVSGAIVRDPSLGTVLWDSLWVWLITYDTMTHIITAVDSHRIVAPDSLTFYTFSAVMPGSYLIKAAGSPGSGSGFVPTYHYSSLSWSTAGYVTVSTVSVTGQDIYMQYGTLTTGPGFIGGDVRYGAGKGTGVGDPVVGLTIYLVNNTTGKLISASKTDASGNYSFHVPYGTYTIYPEQAPLLTTAWNNITVSGTTPSMSAISFKQTSKKITPVGAAVPTVQQLTNMVVYPNPAHNDLNLQWNGSVKNTATVIITNMAGQKVFNNTLKINAAGNTINVSGLQPGAYFLNINAEEGNYSQTLIIK